MIEVRCPECGYVQTLSEARFMGIAEDHLDCPHCRAKVPKQWHLPHQESVPEEAYHKMLAFSRRIINGGEVNRDMVHALESLVRHHGSVDGTDKALGVGYARLGETKKAEEFLTRALAETPADPEILRYCLRMKLAEENFSEAAKVGRALLDVAGAVVEDEDVAGLALALLGLTRAAEAKGLLESYPQLDNRNPVVKQARRGLNRARRPGIRSFLGLRDTLNRLIQGAVNGKKMVRPGAAGNMKPSPRKHPELKPSTPAANERPKKSEKKHQVGQQKSNFGALLDYWIYSPQPAPPRWEDIRGHLAASYPDKDARDSALSMLESLTQKKELTVDHVFRREARELFAYPEELIPRNSRRLSEADRKIVSDAQVISRVRLTKPDRTGLDELVFMTRLVEAVRKQTGGVVQDAVSHTLWGTAEWKKRTAADLRADIVASHVQYDVLDEGGVVWIHSHGMQKFGFPDIELNSVPADLAQAGLNLMVVVGETLLKAHQAGCLHFASPLAIEYSPFSFTMEHVPRDDEGHFPAGCLKILPYVSHYDPQSPDTLKHVLRMCSSRWRGSRRSAGKNRGKDGEVSDQASSPGVQAIKERLLEAHSEARAQLAAFKKSFQEGGQERTSVHAIKVGFPVHEGSYEWMWVSLDEWRGTSVIGCLQNTPLVRQDLRKGCRVELNEQEIFDWVIAQGGDIVQGAFTERALQPQ